MFALVALKLSAECSGIQYYLAFFLSASFYSYLKLHENITLNPNFVHISGITVHDDTTIATIHLVSSLQSLKDVTINYIQITIQLLIFQVVI